MAKTQWIVFTRRTNDPKLQYIERRLDALKIPHRRRGFSFHAPILQVPIETKEDVWAILSEQGTDVHGNSLPIDEIPDDDPFFQMS